MIRPFLGWWEPSKYLNSQRLRGFRISLQPAWNRILTNPANSQFKPAKQFLSSWVPTASTTITWRNIKISFYLQHTDLFGFFQYVLGKKEIIKVFKPANEIIKFWVLEISLAAFWNMDWREQDMGELLGGFYSNLGVIWCWPRLGWLCRGRYK